MDATDPAYEDVAATVEFLKEKVAATCQISLLKPVQLCTIDTMTSSLFSLADDYRSGTNSPTGALIIADSPAGSSADSSRDGSVLDASNAVQCPLEDKADTEDRFNSTPIVPVETVDKKKAAYQEMPDLEKESKETILLQKVIEKSSFSEAIANNASNINQIKGANDLLDDSKKTDQLVVNHKLAPQVTISANSLRIKSPNNAVKNTVRKPRPTIPQQVGRTQFQPILPAGMQRRMLKPKLTNSIESRGLAANGKAVALTPLSPGEKSVKEVVADLCRDQQRLAAEKSASSTEKSATATELSLSSTAIEKKSEETSFSTATSNALAKTNTDDKSNNVNGTKSNIASSSFDSVMTDVIEGRVSTSLHDMQNSDLSMSSLKNGGVKPRSRTNAAKSTKPGKKLNTESMATNDPSKLNATSGVSMPIYPSPLSMSAGNMISMAGGVQQFVIQASSASSMLGSGGGNLISVQPMFIGSPAGASAEMRKSGGPAGSFHVIHVANNNNDNNNNTASNGTVVRGYPPSSMYLHVGGVSAIATNDDAVTAILPTATSRMNHLKPLQPKATTFASAPSASSRNILPNLSKSSNGGPVASLAPSVRMTTATQPSMSSVAGKTLPPTQYFYLPNGATSLNFGAPSAGGTAINNAVNGGGPRVVQLAPSYLTTVPGMGGPANLAMLAPAGQARLISGNGDQFSNTTTNDVNDVPPQFRSIAPANVLTYPAYSSSEAPKKKLAPRRKRKSIDPRNADIDGVQAPPLLNFATEEFTSSSDGIIAEEEEEGENEPPPLLLQDEATSLHGLFLKEAVAMRHQFFERDGARRTRPAIRHFIGGVLIEEDVLPFACEHADLLNANADKISPAVSENETEVDEDKIDVDEKPAKRIRNIEDGSADDGASSPPAEMSSKRGFRGRKSRNGRRKRKIDSPPKSPSSSAMSAAGDSPKESKQKTDDAQPQPAKRGRKPGGGCREVSGLLNMDFGPGKTPFQTTSITHYTRDIMIEAKKQQRCLAFETRLVRRSSEAASTGHTPPPPSTLTADDDDDKTADSTGASTSLPQRRETNDKVKDNDADGAEDEEERCRFCQQKFSQVERLKNKPQYCSKQCFQKHRDRKDKERSFRQFKLAKPADDKPESPSLQNEKLMPSKVSQLPNSSQSNLQSSLNSRITSPIPVLAKRLPCNTSPSTLAPARNAAAALHTQRGVNSPPSSAFQLKPLTPRKSAPTVMHQQQKADSVDTPRQTTPQWTSQPPYQLAMSMAPSVVVSKSPQPSISAVAGQPPQRQPPAGVVSFIPSGAAVPYNNFIYAMPQQPHHLAEFASGSQPRLQPPTLIGFPSSSAASGLFSPLLTSTARPNPSPAIGTPTTPQAASMTLPSTAGMSSAERNAELEKLNAKSIATWTDWEVARWASLVTNSDSNAEPFLCNGIDGTDLAYLDLERMKKHLGLKLGPAMKLNNALNALRDANSCGEKRLRALYAENADLQRLIALGFDNWTRDDVSQWASIVTSSREIGQRFVLQDIDSGSLKLLERQQFREELNIRLGPTLELEDALSIFHLGS